MTPKLSVGALLAVLLAVLLAAVLFAGCGSSKTSPTTTAAQATTTATTTTSTPSTTTTTTPSTTSSTATSTSSTDDSSSSASDDTSEPKTVKGTVGDTLTLSGSGLHDDPDVHTRTKVKVTLKGVTPAITGFDEAKDRKLIGIKLKFTGVAKLRYDDPLPDGTLIVSGGETGKQTNLIPIGGKNPCDNPSLKLKAGQSKDVCIAFDIPKHAKPVSFQYVTDSGYGDTGLWKLP